MKDLSSNHSQEPQKASPANPQEIHETPVEISLVETLNPSEYSIQLDDLNICFGSPIEQEILLIEGPPSLENQVSSSAPQIQALSEELKGIETSYKSPEHGSPTLSLLI